MIKDRVIEFRRVRAGDLVPHPDNWREHPKEQRQAYASILEDIGFAGAILTRLMDDGRLQIIDGHMRSDYSPDIELPCVVTDLTDDEADKALVSFDPLAMMARTNADKLEALHARIHTDHEGLRETLARMASDAGIDLGQDEPPEAPEAQIDRAGELQKEWQTELGQLWEIPSMTGKGVHRVLCGDSTNADDVSRLMGGVKAEICFTSPPYNAAKNSNLPNKRKYYKDGDDENEIDYLRLLTEFTSIYLSFSDFVFINIQSLAGNKIPLIEFLYKLKDYYADTIIWDKQTAEPAMAQNVLNSRYEYIHIFSYAANRRIGTRDFRGTLDNIISINSRQDKSNSDIHRATFPIEFAHYILSNFSNIKDVISDPFLGSGTTLIAAEQTGRICYGMELEPAYIAVTLQRAKDMGLEPRLVNGQ